MSARERLALDLTVFAIVVAAANPVFTGITLHEWLGVVLIVPALVHLIVNWEWVTRAVSAFFGRIRTAARINLVVDAALFLSVIGVTLSGFMVIPGLASALGLQAATLWHPVHLITSNLTVAFTLLHFALHWKWVTSVVRRMIAVPSTPAHVPARAPLGATAPRPVTAPTSFDRG
ncbi:MAG: DUF4405 domain-containing protein [Coriobacteriia bacterium]|nr:DUF4405 domain-containing protein [Coriobacteriia bacterium]